MVCLSVCLLRVACLDLFILGALGFSVARGEVRDASGKARSALIEFCCVTGWELERIVPNLTAQEGPG